jgi:5-methylcytosine-specific restriction endonuclease McrA
MDVRRFVWMRDKGKCRYADPASGMRCDSSYFVQIDHILPLALGGKSTENNLRLLCAQHNQHRAGRTFGPKPQK